MEEQVLPVKFNKIHINPKFRNAHINPTFFTPPTMPAIPANIHVNPKFFSIPPVPQPPVPLEAPEVFAQKEPIYKTRRKIIRNVSPAKKQRPEGPTSRLVKISKNKLIRTSSQVPTMTKKTPTRPTKAGKSLYKIDRRNLGNLTLRIPPQNHRKLLNSFSPKIVTTTNKKLMRM